MQEREKTQTSNSLAGVTVFPRENEVFLGFGGLVCAAGSSGKEEPASMHGRCEEKTRGQTGGEGKLNIKAESVKPRCKSKNLCGVFLKY
jgi:hypothetical protein